MQGTRVRALVWEDPTCRGATKPVRHSYWAWALEPVLLYKRSHRNEKPTHRNKEQPPLAATRESPCATTKTQSSQNKTNKQKPQIASLEPASWPWAAHSTSRGIWVLKVERVLLKPGLRWSIRELEEMLEALFTFFHLKCRKKYEALLIFDIWIKRAQVYNLQIYKRGECMLKNVSLNSIWRKKCGDYWPSPFRDGATFSAFSNCWLQPVVGLYNPLREFQKSKIK